MFISRVAPVMLADSTDDQGGCLFRHDNDQTIARTIRGKEGRNGGVGIHQISGEASSIAQGSYPSQADGRDGYRDHPAIHICRWWCEPADPPLWVSVQPLLGPLILQALTTSDADA